MEEQFIQQESAEIKICRFLSSINNYTPQEMVDILDKNNYVGQLKAKKSICLLAYRHINRLQKIYLEKVPIDMLPAKENILCVGPTGCGKTHLIELIFSKIIPLPHVIIDITSYSGTGYVGQDVGQIFTRLIYAAEDFDLAEIGIVCIDEFDKIATSKNTGVFSGQGTTKDVNGYDVQKELLKMFESSLIDVPSQLSHSEYAQKIPFNTQNVPFIACGAFSSLKKTLNLKNKKIGFYNSNKEALTNPNYSRNDFNKVSIFEDYGLMPELIGRFSRILPFELLEKSTLKEILLKNTISKYEKELSLENIKLVIDEKVCDKIVDEAYEKGIGARGLKSFLLEYIEDACFEIYSKKSGNKSIIIFLDTDGEINWKIE